MNRRSLLPSLALALGGPVIAGHEHKSTEQPLSPRELQRLGKHSALLKKLLDFAESPELPADAQEAHDRLAAMLFADNLADSLGHDLYQERTDTWQTYGCPRCGLTYDRVIHHGVIPFKSLCGKCGSLRTSGGLTHELPEGAVVRKEWYRPSPTELVRVLNRDADHFDHLHRGGLEPRPTPGMKHEPAKPIRRRSMFKTGRNQPCPCGSGRKYKRCCLDKQSEEDEA